jgi:hypothetical protein
MSRKSATIFGQGTIPEPSTPHIDREVALVAQTAARIPQIAEMTLSFPQQIIDSDGSGAGAARGGVGPCQESSLLVKVCVLFQPRGVSGTT